MDSWIVSTRVKVKAESKQEAEDKVFDLLFPGFQAGSIEGITTMPTLMVRRPGT